MTAGKQNERAWVLLQTPRARNSQTTLLRRARRAYMNLCPVDVFANHPVVKV